MGVGSPRISVLESMAVVTEEAARRYREALATCDTAAFDPRIA